MKQHLKYILLLLVFIGTLKQSIAQTTITSSVTLTQTVLNGYTWPVTINGGSDGSPVIVTLGEDVTLTNSQNYFVINSEYVTIDGNGKKITLSNITNYRGLVANGNYPENSWSSSFSNSIVKNIGVLSNNSSLNEYCGWIGQQGYGNGAGFSITNCYSNGEMTNDGSGGILGQAYMNGTISNCYSLGNISGNYTAGIVASYNQDASRIINCYANGTISGSNANGICEPDMMMMPGMSGGASFTNCYAANGVFNTTTANSNLTGTDGTVWNTSVNPYTLSVFYNNLGLLNTRATSAAYSLRLLYPNYTGPLARININGSFYDIYPDNSSSKIFSLNSTISNSQLVNTIATPVSLGAVTNSTIQIEALSSSIALVTYQTSAGVKVSKLSYDGTTLTVASTATVYNNTAVDHKLVKVSTTSAVVSYVAAANSLKLLTISDALTLGTVNTFGTIGNEFDITFNNNKLLLVYLDTNLKSSVGTISSGVITFGASTDVTAYAVSKIHLISTDTNANLCAFYHSTGFVEYVQLTMDTYDVNSVSTNVIFVGDIVKVKGAYVSDIALTSTYNKNVVLSYKTTNGKLEIVDITINANTVSVNNINTLVNSNGGTVEVIALYEDSIICVYSGLYDFLYVV